MDAHRIDLTSSVSFESRQAMTRLSDQHDFAQTLSRARHDGKSSESSAREGAEALVSVAFVQPILKKLRESTLAAAPFAPNSAERTFRSMGDAVLAQHIVRSQRWSLVDRVARDLRRDTSGADTPSGNLAGAATF